jgi:hypothetical protein
VAHGRHAIDHDACLPVALNAFHGLDQEIQRRAVASGCASPFREWLLGIMAAIAALILDNDGNGRRLGRRSNVHFTFILVTFAAGTLSNGHGGE